MEIVGIVAGIPALIHAVQGLTATLQALANRRHSAKVAGELLLQLMDIENILKDVQQRWKSNPIDNCQLQRLAPVLSQLRTEFSSLQSDLQVKFSKEASSFLRRALPLSTRLDRTLKESLNRVTQVKTSLTLIIVHHHDRLAEEHRKVSSSDLRLALRGLLRPSGDSFIPQRLDNTCEWIWSHPAFTTWMDTPVSPSADFRGRIFCLYGPKGCGKSVLLKSVAERLRGRGEHVSHFAFWAGSEAQRRFLDFLRSLLWQLLGPLSDSQVRMVTSQLAADSSIDERNVIVAVEQALALNTADFYCLVDGVDESLDDWNIRGQGCLETMLGLVKRHPGLYLLVAGREPSIRTLLKESTPNLEVTEDCTRSDINKFIAAELDDVPTIQSPEAKQMVQRSLQEQSKVMFLWTTLILNQLRRCYTAEELSITLKQVPHDLDREYHRLFLQLMARTSGTRTRPSASMNRARILLMSILASPEPLTVDELRYTYAAHVHRGPRIEDSLIPVDGIIDACGDFLRITDGRYHLIHASLIDFLTRSSDEWRAEDCEIEYFRIDRSVAHKHMAAVCVGYLERLDLGYPLTDGGAPTLPLKYPFFSYATALLPYFLARVILHGDSAWGHSEIRRVGKTPQAWALIEYALATIQGIQPHSNGDHLHYWVELASVQFDWRPQALFAIYETELQRRLDCFGAEDSRYQVLQSISALIVTFYPYRTGTSSSGSVSNSRRYASSHASRLSQKGTIPAALSKYLMGNIGFVGQKIPQALSTLTKGFRELAVLNLKQMTSDLMTLSPDVLPVPVVLLMFQMAFRRYDWVSAEKLAATALKRTRGKNNFWECLSLMCLSFALWNRMESPEEAIQLALECIRKTAQADSQPHFLATKTVAYIILTRLLILEERDEEARNALHNLESLIGMDRQKSGSRIAETLYRTRRGLAWRMTPLQAVASDYNEKGKYTDAANLMNRALDISGGVASMEQLALPTRDCLETQRTALYNAGDIQACMTCCRRLLEFLDGLARDRADESNNNCRRDTYIEMGWCFARLGSFDQAKEAFRQAAKGLQLSNHSNHENHTEALFSLAYGLLLTGNYEQSAIIVRKFSAPGTVTEDKTTLCPIPFGRIQSLVDKMEGTGIIESDYRNFLRSASLLKAAEDLTDEDASEDADWWIDKVSSLESPPHPAFRYKCALLHLKVIDILLGVTNRKLTAVIYYRRLADSLSAMGHHAAAGLVSADAASRVLATSNEAPPLTVKLKRARSFSESASGQPLVTCRRRLLRPRSWELLCSVRD